MVTKRTGRPRGRPRKVRPPARRVGRPSLNLRADPDRYAIAYLDAMLGLRLASESACAKALAIWQLAKAGNPPKLSVDRRHVITNWRGIKDRPGERDDLLPGARAGTIRGRVATFRNKRRHYRSPRDLEYRTRMSAAFRAVSASEIADTEVAKWVALLAAALVGEEEFARRVLWPMIDARFSG